jgi:VIT1/CCC1 family predicted Fe2+/Mn2+ transporter
VAEGPRPETKTLRDLEAEHRAPPARFFHQHGPEATEQNPLRNYVRDLILGFNDGLVSVYAIVAGVVGAGFAAPGIAVAGTAAGVAGALSMGIGEYLSTKSQAEYYEAERRLERQHIRDYPELEHQEMRGYMAAKGLEGELLDRVLDRITSDPERFLDVMMREEFGHSPQTDRSPWVASGVIMAAFVVGALLPVLPFVFLDAGPGIVAASVLSLGALLLAGAVKAWVSGLGKLRSALEMAALGIAAAVITYGVGAMIGVAV